MIAALLVGTTLAAGPGFALADGGKGVAVKPLTPKAGETIAVKVRPWCCPIDAADARETGID